MLLRFLPQSDVYPQTSRQYFQVLDNLLKDFEPEGIKYKDLLFTLIASIAKHPVMESNSTVGLEGLFLLFLIQVTDNGSSFGE